MTTESAHPENPRMDIDNERPARSPEIPQSPNAIPDNMESPDAPALPIDPDANESEDEVEEASDESFPASDPPSYTRSTTTRD
jgi:hypothetical protein